MPIEIRELVIRATVDPNGSGSGNGSGGCTGSGAKPTAARSRQVSTQTDDDLVQTCVREVLRVLDEKRER
jgi:hypothetical protein